MKDELIKRTQAANGLLYEYRLTLWGRYDKERHTAFPDKRTQYLVPKRTIRLELNDFPVMKLFTTREGTQKIEKKFVFQAHLGDQLEFMDTKQEADHFMAAAAVESAHGATVEPPAPSVNLQIAELQKMMLTISKRLLNMPGGSLPVPDQNTTTLSASDTIESPLPEGSQEAPTDVDDAAEGLGGIVNPFVSA